MKRFVIYDGQGCPILTLTRTSIGGAELKGWDGELLYSSDFDKLANFLIREYGEEFDETEDTEV